MLNAQGAAGPDETGRGSKNAKKSKNGGNEATTLKASAREAKDARDRAGETSKTAKTLGAGKDNDVQRLAADVALLRTELKGLRDAFAPPAIAQTSGGKKGKNSAATATTTFADAAPPVSAEAGAGITLAQQALGALAERHDSAVLYGWAFRAGGDEQQSGARAVFGLGPILARSDDDRAARVAYALSSGPKIALARLLLTHGALPAARLGEEAHLTTGSLYHHLREMSHAGVIGSAGRSRYALTTIGQQAILLLLALSTDDIAAAARSAP